MIKFPIHTENVTIDTLKDELLQSKNISVDVLRLDKLHPVISGNKLFKLFYYLEEAVYTKKKIITFGGAYSNHLSATAKACKELNVECIGMVRGEEPQTLSHTLLFCLENNMKLVFLNREDYDSSKVKNDTSKFKNEYGEHIFVPEGGYSRVGVKGASLIASYFDNQNYSHICCAFGTGTTIAGLIKTSNPDLPIPNILAFSALKGLTDFNERMQYLLQGQLFTNYQLISDYHFGGYAKKTNILFEFMNELYSRHNIPTDIVYTGKMLFGVWDLIQRDHFQPGSKILCIHTGGLQGNDSLPAGTLIF